MQLLITVTAKESYDQIIAASDITHNKYSVYKYLLYNRKLGVIYE